MKKDIPQFKVEDLAIAVVPPDDRNDDMWDVYIINLRNEAIHNVLISSRGYGEIDGFSRKTTTLRHFFEAIGPLEVVAIEPIPEQLFQLANEYWVSFTYKGYMYDKRYVFVQGSLDTINFTSIPFINKDGVMIR